jgi:hypothetical protein
MVLSGLIGRVLPTFRLLRVTCVVLRNMNFFIQFDRNGGYFKAVLGFIYILGILVCYNVYIIVKLCVTERPFCLLFNYLHSTLLFLLL